MTRRDGKHRPGNTGGDIGGTSSRSYSTSTSTSQPDYLKPTTLSGSVATSPHPGVGTMPLHSPSLLQALSPRIAIFATDEVNQSCLVNGCKGLDELFRPWESGVERVSILSSLLTPTVHPTYALRFTSHEALVAAQTGGRGAVPYSPEVVIDVVSNLVGKLKPEDEKHYDVFRDVLFASRPISEHETFNHPVCFILATSTSTPDPLSALASMQNKSLSSPVYQSRPYMDGQIGAVLRFWLVVHDVAREGPNLDRAHALLAQVKKIYGSHATLLIINSSPTATLTVAPSSPSTSCSLPETPPFAQAYATALSNLALNDPFMNLTNLLSDTTSIREVSEYTTAPSSLVLSDSANTLPTGAYPTSGRATEYARCLSPQDIVAIRGFLRELTTQSLIPWMEGRIREWNEIFNNSRRGITGRLFGAGRKFFGSGSTGNKGNAGSGYNSVRGYYPPNTAESISRRLGDFAFMLRDYKLASTVYDSIRRDFIQDGAVKLGAAATEMYGLSTLMGLSPLGDSKNSMRVQQQSQTLLEIESWLEQAILAYASRPNIGLDALRVTVLHYEAWKAWAAVDSGWDWAGVSSSLVRGAGDAEEVPSAILLEQAALVDLKSPKRRPRKHAFHMVMAARRYEKSGHKAYSRRCLQTALKFYRDQQPPWLFAQNYIEFSLGRQAYTLGESDLAVEHFVRLLRRGMGSDGQGDVLEDFVLAYQQLQSRPDLYKEALSQINLPTPIFEVSKTAIRIPSDDSDFGVGRGMWEELEDVMLVSGFRKSSPRPQTLLRPHHLNVGAIDEPLFVSLIASNPMNASIKISNLSVQVVNFVDPEAHIIGVTVDVMDDFEMAPLETREVYVKVTCSEAGTYRMDAISFLFHGLLPCTQSLQRKGKRLFTTKQERLEPTYAPDNSLDFTIGPPKPNVQVDFDFVPTVLVHGELRHVDITIANTGSMAVRNVRVLPSLGGFLSLTGNERPACRSSNVLTGEEPLTISLPNDLLEPGQSAIIPVLTYGNLIGDHQILFLFAYQAGDEQAIFGSTRVAHYFQVRPLLSLEASCQPIWQSATEYSVNVHIENTSDDLEVKIGRVDVISPAWKASEIISLHESLERLGESQIGFCHGLITKSDTFDELDLQESFMAKQMLAIIKGQSPPQDMPRPVTVHQSTITTSSKESIEPLRPPIDDLRQSFVMSSLSQQYPTIASSSLSRISTLYNSLDLDIAVYWSIASSTDPESAFSGCNLLHGIRPCPAQSILDDAKAAILGSDGKNIRSMYEETNRRRRVLLESVLEGPLAVEENPLRLRIVVKGTKRGRIRHDFAEGPLCISPIAEIVNSSPRFPVKYTLRMNKRASQSSSLAREHASPPLIRYVGAVVRRGMLKPLDSFHVDLKAFVDQPGLYDLNAWQLDIDVGTEHGGEWTSRVTFELDGGQPEVNASMVQVDSATWAEDVWSIVNDESE